MFSSKSTIAAAIDQDADPPGVFGINHGICLVFAVSAVALVSSFATGECHVVVCRPGWGWGQLYKGLKGKMGKIDGHRMVGS